MLPTHAARAKGANIMKKFDWFTILGALVITENTILMIAQGGWFTFAGLIFGGIFAWVAYWDSKRYKTIKSDHEEARLNFLNSNDEIQSEADTNNSSPSGINFEAIEAAYSALASRDEVSVDEFAQILNAVEPRFIGDLGCKNNARSPFLRCAINPSGECQGCKDYEEA